jgi:hypothetical protein
MCGSKGQCDINGTQWLKSQTHLKGIVVGRVMKGFFVAMLNIGDTLIPYAWMFVFVHAQDMHDHFVDDLCLDINLGVEGDGFCELSVQ